MTGATLSAVMVVRDEAEMLEGALRTLGFCDDIVVVIDDRTTDGTEAIARRYTDKVLVSHFDDFAAARNVGIARARGSWILRVDADERITPALAREIRAALDGAGPDVLGFRAPTINFFWGRRMRWGGWDREMHVRIIRRDRANFSGRVHEVLPFPEQTTPSLEGELWHFSHRSIEENLSKTIIYGDLDALDRHEHGAPTVTPWTLVRVVAREFGRRMLRRQGFRDGMPGIIEAFFQPFALFCASVMLWERQQGDAIRRRYEELERELERVR